MRGMPRQSRELTVWFRVRNTCENNLISAEASAHLPDKRPTPGWDTMAKSSDQTQERISEDTGLEWLKAHTLQDIRDLANDLSNHGEDVTELVEAVNDLEFLLREVELRSRPENAP